MSSHHDPRYLTTRRRHRPAGRPPAEAPRPLDRRRRRRRRRCAPRLLSTWRGSEASVSASRLRIAEVTRGTLVRDASVNGRVVAAVSPTLYAKAAGHRQPEGRRRRHRQEGPGAGRARIARPGRRAEARDARPTKQLKAEVGAPADPGAQAEAAGAEATPTPPRSSACPPSARWSATSSVAPGRRHRQDRLPEGQGRAAVGRDPRQARRRRPPRWKATTSRWH